MHCICSAMYNRASAAPMDRLGAPSSAYSNGIAVGTLVSLAHKLHGATAPQQQGLNLIPGKVNPSTGDQP